MTALSDQVDQIFAEWDTPNTPGCVLAVIQDGEIVYSRAYGMADLERDVPLSAASVLDLGSTGKQFTAVLVGLLAEQGLLALSDSIQKYIPELPDYSRGITIHHLIYHTSGLRDYTTLMYAANKPFENAYGDDELFDLIVRQQGVNFAPGAEFLYSNTGYLLLGVIAQRVGGKSYPELVRDYILAPLGMTHTDFNDSFKRIVKQRALAYSPAENGYETDISFCGGYGDGAILSCVGDLLLWDRNFYENRLGRGGAGFIEQILTPGSLNDGKLLAYAFGLFVREQRGLKMVSHGGAWAGYRSELLRFPEQRLSVICLANFAELSPSTKALQVAELYLAEHFTDAVEAPAEPGASDTPHAVDAAQFAGVYRSENGGSLLEISSGDDGLQMEIMGVGFQLAMVSSSTLKTVDGPVSIVLTVQPDGAIAVSIQEQTPDVYQRIAVTAPQAVATGDYYSSELDITYHLSQQGEQAFVKRGYAPQEPLKPISRDLYSSSFLIFQFSRDAQDKVAGFELFAGRVVGLRFERQAP